MKELVTWTIACLAIVLVVGSAAAAVQYTWHQIDPSQLAPPARRSHAMAVDPINQYTLLFGGYGNGTHLGDAWKFDLRNETWNRVETTSAPSPRAATTLVYEPQQSRFILFGGFNYEHSIVSNDTWAFDTKTNTWDELKPLDSPNARGSYGMAYDSKRDMIVLFGGFTEDDYFNDLWAYDPSKNSWKRVDVVGTVPASRGAMGFAYDEGNDVFVMYGGFSDAGFFGDTWIYDPSISKWKEMEPEHHPPPLRTRMIYDNDTRQSVFFGGDVSYPETGEPSIEPYDGIWMYDYSQNNWSEVAVGNDSKHPQKRSLHAIAYSTPTSEMIVFGGTDSLIDEQNFIGSEFQDTWILSRAQEQTLLPSGQMGSIFSGPFLVALIITVAAAATIVALRRLKKLKQ